MGGFRFVASISSCFIEKFGKFASGGSNKTSKGWRPQILIPLSSTQGTCERHLTYSYNRLAGPIWHHAIGLSERPSSVLEYSFDCPRRAAFDPQASFALCRPRFSTSRKRPFALVSLYGLPSTCDLTCCRTGAAPSRCPGDLQVALSPSPSIDA